MLRQVKYTRPRREPSGRNTPNLNGAASSSGCVVEVVIRSDVDDVDGFRCVAGMRRAYGTSTVPSEAVAATHVSHAGRSRGVTCTITCRRSPLVRVERGA